MKGTIKKRLLALLVALTVICTTCSINNMGASFAFTATSIITVGENEFRLAYIPDSGNTFSDIGISPSSTTSKTLTYPTFDEALVALKATGGVLASRWSEKMILSSINSQATSITIPSDYYTIPSNFLQANTSVENINITTNNDIEIAPLSFSRCKNLKNVNISAPNSTVTIKSDAFYEDTSLQNVNITAKNIIIKNAFTNSSLKELSLNGSVSADSVLGISSLETLNTNGTTSLPSGFIKSCNIQNVSLAGSTTINTSCFSECQLTNLNLEGTTSLRSQSFGSCAITNMSVNGKTTFANKTLEKCTVTNLYFNLDNRNGCGNISYSNGNDRLGSYTTVSNMYFNYSDIHGQTGNVQELNAFPLGDTEESSLNCENIYFFDADFKYIGGGSTYKRTLPGKTNVYGWGGAMAWDTDGNRKSAYDMYQEWIENDTCEFYNYVKNTNSGVAADVFTLNVSELYIPDESTSVTYDFSSTDNIVAWANFESQNNQYAEKNEFVRANGYCMKPLSMNVDEAATSFATNFNYRILKKDDNISGLSKEKYNYYYSSTDEAAGWYTSLTTATDELTEGKNYYLIEVGGVKYPFTIQAKYNKIEKIQVENSGAHLNVDEKVTPDMLKVTATYTNGTTALLSDTAYEIVPHTIVEGQNNVTVRVKAHISSEDYVSEEMVVIGYSDTCTGFTAITDIKQLYEGGTLNVSDVVLSNVTYKNPTRKDETIRTGFKFFVDGQEQDTYTVKKGVNTISVVYKGYILENALVVAGLENTITKVEAVYAGTVYEGMELSTDNASLAVYIYENNEKDGKLLTDNTGITFGSYTIAPGENLIDVYYRGIKTTQPMKVNGLADYATEIISATYKGSLIAGYSPVPADIELQASMASGRKVDTTKDTNMTAYITIAEKVLEETTATLTIGFKNATYTLPIKLGIVETTVPTQSAISATPIPTIIGTPVVTSSGTSIPTTIPTPVASNPPAQTDNQVSTPVPQETIQPVPTAETKVQDNPIVMETSETEQTPVKGDTYTVNGIKYRVISVNSITETGSVSITGYTKKAKVVNVVSKVKIKGYTFKVTQIAKNAFKNCTKLKNTVTIPENVESIGDNAFYGCKNITKVVIGKKVKSIGSKSFYGCQKLRTVDLRKASKLSKVGAGAFKKNAKKRIFKISKREKAYIEKLLKGKK